MKRIDRSSKGHYESETASITATLGLHNHFEPYSNKLPVVAVGLFSDGDLPRLCLIPAKEWSHPNKLLMDRDYQGLKSKPEYGLNISKRNLPLLEQYRFEDTVKLL